MTKTTKTTATVKPTSTKDSGAVKVGGACIRFASTSDKGKVHVGGACMRF